MHIITSIIIGLTVGIVGSIFSKALHLVTTFRIEHPLVLLALPLAGIIICFLYQHTNSKNKQGTNLVIDAINKDTSLPSSLAPTMFFSTLLTHLCGGSAGREGAALQIGGSLGQTVASILHFPHMKEATLCGMAACFSALFLTPLTATVFILEIAAIGAIQSRHLIPTALSAFTAFFVAKLCHLEVEAMPLSLTLDLQGSTLVKIILLAIALGCMTILFCEAMHIGHRLFPLKNPYLNIVCGAIILILIYQWTGTRYQGAGMDIIIQTITNEQFLPYDFILKLVVTAITLGCGFKGGEIVPCFFVGTTFGALVASLLGLPINLGGALGLCLCFGCATRCTLSGMLLGIELFGVSLIPYLLIAMVISYTISHKHTLYQTQFIDEPLKLW